MLKKILFGSLIVASSLYAGEFEFGSGTFEMQGGLVGLDNTKSADVTTYSLVEQHKNIFSSKWFYRYNITWYDSKDINTIINDYNSIARGVSLSDTTDTTTSSTSIDYKLQGIDLNIVLGKDIIHKDEKNFIGLGILIGASIPWIDSKSDSNSDTTSDIIKDTKTKITTYKIGPSISGRYGIGKYFSVYGGASYAYQTASVKNDEIGVDTTANGSFYSYGFGLRFTPFSYNNNMKYYNLKARLYATIGYRYSNWILKDLNLDVTGANLSSTKSDLKMNSSTLYVGIGYSF